MKSVRQLLQAKGREVYSITPEARVFDALKLMADPIAGVAAEPSRPHAQLGGFAPLPNFGIPEEDLRALAAAAAARGGNQANPRPASAGEILSLYRSIW